MSIDAFVWGPHFECGIPVIDGQHQRLVELVNRLGQLLIDDDLAHLPEVVAEARAYADYHFRSEEGVWRTAGLDAAAQAQHADTHREFTLLLDHFANDFSGNPTHLAALLHNYLAAWLAFHIIGDDQQMARTALAARPKLADDETIPDGRPVARSRTESILLDALHKLYTALTGMNVRLRQSRDELDRRVQERTHELEQANAELRREHEQLIATTARLDEARTRLMENDKMASIGQLAAGVAHEINNPIGFVSSNLGALGEYLEDAFAMLDAYAAAEPLIARDPQAIAAIRAAKGAHEIAFVREDAQALLAESRDGLARVRRIVHDLRVFSHVDGAEMSRCNLDDGLASTLNIVWNEIRQKAELRREFGAMPAVICNPGEINQIFLNLLMNALHAIEHHGVITVRSGDADGGAWFEVEDDGCGMSEEVRKRIFDPFFTTKPVGVGTGLGLSLAWTIVDKHGGRISVDSAPGRGARFRVWLPAAGDGKPKGEK